MYSMCHLEVLLQYSIFFILYITFRIVTLRCSHCVIFPKRSLGVLASFHSTLASGVSILSVLCPWDEIPVCRLREVSVGSSFQRFPYI